MGLRDSERLFYKKGDKLLARKIKVPLEMKDGYMVRTIDELRENFDAEKLLTYFLNGKLQIWLKERFYDDYLERIKELDPYGSNTLYQLCKCFEINADREDIEQITKEFIAKKNKFELIKKFSDDIDLTCNVDITAFNQEELEKLLKQGHKIIYLLGDKFEIDSNVSCVKFIGIIKLILVINSSEIIDFKKNCVEFENIEFDEKYKQMIKIYENEVKNSAYKTSCEFQDKITFQDTDIIRKLYYDIDSVIGKYSICIDYIGKGLREIIKESELKEKFENLYKIKDKIGIIERLKGVDKMKCEEMRILKFKKMVSEITDYLNTKEWQRYVEVLFEEEDNVWYEIINEIYAQRTGFFKFCRIGDGLSEIPVEKYRDHLLKYYKDCYGCQFQYECGVPYHVIFWMLFHLSVCEKTYENNLCIVADTAYLTGFTEDMLKDWVEAIKAVLEGKSLQEVSYSTEEAKNFFVNRNIYVPIDEEHSDSEVYVTETLYI